MARQQQQAKQPSGTSQHKQHGGASAPEQEQRSQRHPGEETLERQEGQSQHDPDVGKVPHNPAGAETERRQTQGKVATGMHTQRDTAAHTPKQGEIYRCRTCGMELQVTADCDCEDADMVRLECCGEELARV